MTKGIKILEKGGVEVMNWVRAEMSGKGPGAGEVRIKHSAIGVNYIDTYHRSGIYPVQLPCILGIEAVGNVVAIGDGVEGFVVGDRVGYASGPLGAYVEERDFPYEKLISPKKYEILIQKCKNF